MYCNQCGENVTNEDAFCSNCGNQLINQDGVDEVLGVSNIKSENSKGKNSRNKGRKIFLPLLIISLILVFSALSYIYIQNNKFEIISYYPESGHAGSYVLLELNKDFDENLGFYYGEQEIFGARITDKIVGINIPLDSVSNHISLEYKNKQASVPFNVLKEEKYLIYEDRIMPSEDLLEIVASENVSVTLPAGFLKEEQRLTVSKVENPNVLNPSPLNLMEVYDISIDGMTDLHENILISIKYDPASFDDGPIEDQMEPVRWDEENNEWVDLFYRVDEENHTIHFLTDHLSFFAYVKTSVSVAGLLKAATTVGAVSYGLEWLANDVYISHDNNIRILYSKKAISNIFPDEDWKNVVSKFNLSHTHGYRYIYPFMVQDVGNILESALKSYIDYGFSDPTTDRFAGSIFKRRIKVKIDSYYNYLKGGEFNYQSFWDQINIPTEIIKLEVYDPVLKASEDYKISEFYLTHILAHELFHAIQRPYYGMFTEFRQNHHMWWIEATADYAGNDIANNRSNLVLNERLGNKYFDYPLSSTGRKVGSFIDKEALDYEYLTAIFVRYLVTELDLDLKEIIEFVAKEGSRTDAIAAVMSFVLENTDKTSFDAIYGEFVAWFLKEGALTIVDFDTDNKQNVVADQSKIVYIPQNEAYMEVDISQGEDSLIYLYKTSEESISSGDFQMNNVSTLSNSGKSNKIKVESGDIILFILPNTSESERSVSADIFILGNEEEGKKKVADFSTVVAGNHTAKVWALKFEDSNWSIEPNPISMGEFNKKYDFTIKGEQLSEDIKDIVIEYDFGDGLSQSKGRLTGQRNSNGNFEAVISYAYPIGGHLEQKDFYDYRLTIKAIHKNNVIGHASGDIRLKPVAVSILAPRIKTYELKEGATEARHDFVAGVTPPGSYRFEWDFGDGSPIEKVPGSESTISHTYKKTGTFYPEVRVYDVNGNQILSKDSITIILDDGTGANDEKFSDEEALTISYDKSIGTLDLIEIKVDVKNEILKEQLSTVSITKKDFDDSIAILTLKEQSGGPKSYLHHRYEGEDSFSFYIRTDQYYSEPETLSFTLDFRGTDNNQIALYEGSIDIIPITYHIEIPDASEYDTISNDYKYAIQSVKDGPQPGQNLASRFINTHRQNGMREVENMDFKLFMFYIEHKSPHVAHKLNLDLMEEYIVSNLKSLVSVGGATNFGTIENESTQSTIKSSITLEKIDENLLEEKQSFYGVYALSRRALVAKIRVKGRLEPYMIGGEQVYECSVHKTFTFYVGHEIFTLYTLFSEYALESQIDDMYKTLEDKSDAIMSSFKTNSVKNLDYVTLSVKMNELNLD